MPLSCGIADRTPTIPMSAIIRFEPDTFNMGTITKGDIVTVEFKYFNDSEFPLQIKNIGSSCGCTKPEFDTSVIKPHEFGSIKTSYSSKNDSGSIIKTLVVESNTKPTLHVIYLSGIVKGT